MDPEDGRARSHTSQDKIRHPNPTSSKMNVLKGIFGMKQPNSSRKHTDSNSSRISIEDNSYYTKDSQPDRISSSSRDVIVQRTSTQRKTVKNKHNPNFFISEKFESLNYTTISNKLEVAEQKTKTFGGLMKEDCLRVAIFVLTGILTGTINVGMETCIHMIGHYKYAWFTDFVINTFERTRYELLMVVTARFLMALVPIMLGTALVVYVAPFASGGGVAQCIAYLNGVRVPNVLSIRGLLVKFFSTVCTCVSGLAGGKEGPAMHIGATVGGGLPSILPWLKFKSDQERRDLAAAGFGAGIAVVFGAPIGGMLLALEEAVSFWDIGLMWKMYLCCIVCYAIGSVNYSVFLGFKSVELNNPELSTLGVISATVKTFEIFELVFFALQALIAGLIGALLIKIHIWVINVRQKVINSNLRKLLLSFIAAIIVCLIQTTFIRFFRYCSKVTESELERYNVTTMDGSETFLQHAHQMYCANDEHSDMSLLFDQRQGEILRTFFGERAIQMESLALYSLAYFFLLCLTWGLSISYGVFIPQIVFGAAWGRLYGTLLQHYASEEKWAQPAKYAYIGAAAQLSATLGKTFSVLMIMVEAAGSITLAFPLMMVVIITKTLESFFAVPIYHAQMLLQGLPFLFTKPPPLSLDVTSAHIMSQAPLVVLSNSPHVEEIVHVIKTTNHNGFPVLDEHSQLVGLILRQQLLVLLKYKAYKFPPPQTTQEMRECHQKYIRLSRKHLNVQEILDSVKPKYYKSKLDLAPYYDGFPITVVDSTPAVRAYSVFRNLALRHLIVLKGHVPVGMITRKDLAKFHTFENFFRMGVTELVKHK